MLSREVILRAAAMAGIFLFINEIAVLEYLLEEKKKKRVWVRDYITEESRIRHGDYNNLMRELRMNVSGNGPLGFVELLRVTPAQFDELLPFVEPIIAKKDTNFRKSLPAGLRLGLTLRYLSTGDMQKSLAYSFRISPSSTSILLKETSIAIWQALQSRVLTIPSRSQWKNIMEDFWNVWNFPNCVGAIDGKHIQIQCPSKSGSAYFSYKGVFSIVLLAVCDARYKFIYVDIGSYGSLSDGGIFASSKLGRALRRNSLDMPSKRMLPNTDEEISVFFVGDEAFGLSERIMRPYSRKDARTLSDGHRIFNYRLSRARRTIENTFGIVSSRWRLLRNTIVADVDNTISYVKAIVCLHNYLKTQDDSKPPAQRLYFPPSCVDQEDHNGNVAFAEWRSQVERLRDIGRLGSNNASRIAYAQRDILAGFFGTPFGSLPWQENVVNRGK